MTVLAEYCLAAALCPGAAAPACAQVPAKVTIGSRSAGLSAAGPRIARPMGLFEKHGIDATVKPMDNGSITTMALFP